MLKQFLRKQLIRIMLICVVAILFGVIVSNERVVAQLGDGGAQLGGQKFGGLDLVFLIDQSGSMEVNDPNYMRIITVEWILQNLGIDNLLTRPGAKHRIAVIGYGTNAELTTAGLESLQTTTKADWDDRFSSIAEKIEAEDLGNTDPKKALELAYEVFQNAGEAGTQGERTKGIIILTDGPPYIAGWQNIKDSTGKSMYGNNFYNDYFRIMGEYIGSHLPIATTNRTPDGYHIWVFGFTQGGDPKVLTDWASQETYWERILNRADNDRVRGFSIFYNGLNSASILEVLDTIMIGGVCDERLINNGQELPCIVPELFDVPPYLSEARFTVFKPTDGTSVRILNADKQEPEWNDRESFGPLIEELVYTKPQPGVWEWQQNNAASGLAKVKFTPDFVKAELVEPASEQDLFDTVNLRVQLVNEDGTQMREVPEYPIEATAIVEAPDGSQKEYPLRSDDTGQLMAANALSLDQPGKYTVYVSGQTKYGKERVLELFQRVPLQFNVGSLVPTLVTPAGDVSQYHAIPIQIDITKPDGSAPGASTRDAVDVEYDLTWPDGSAHAMLVRANGSSYVAEEPLIPDQSGNYEIHARGTMQVGDQTITVFDSELPFAVLDLNYAIVAPIDEIPQHGISQIELTLNNGKAGFYEEDSTVPWEVSVRAVDPSNVEAPGSPFQMNKTGLGIYSTSFTPAVDGVWELVASAEVILPNGNKVRVFDDLRADVSVYPTSRVQLQVLSPQPKATQNIRNGPKIYLVPESIIGAPTDTQFRLRVSDDNGNPVPIADLSPNGGQVVSAYLNSPEDFGNREQVHFTVNPRNPNELIADLSDLTASGIYTFSAALETLNKEYEAGSAGISVVVFERTDPYATITKALLVLEIILLLLILFLIFRFFKVRANPVQGTLVFGSNLSHGRGLGEMQLGSYGKNVFTIDQKTIMAFFDPAVAEVVKKLRIKQGTSGKDLGDNDFGYGGGGASIRVTAWGPDGKSFITDEELPEGMRPPVGDNGEIYMTYKKE